ncbi:MAG: BtaA family protein [Verrucomicrobia bacterium]|nr:BtaA family protein [Verrucomicrobiota bacterium]
MTTTTRTVDWVEHAVSNQSLRTEEGLWQRVFARWFSSFVYNQIWEDPRVDAHALDLGPRSRVLTISSGGCNVLHYLLHDPAQLTAVDLNGAHLALLRLKLAALQTVPSHVEFYELFGLGGGERNLSTYERWIRPRLDDTSRSFWESRRPLQGPRLRYLRSGLYEHAQLGRLLGLLQAYAWARGRRLSAVLEARTLSEQRAIFDREIAPLLDSTVFRLLTKLPFALFSLGIPPQQRSALQAAHGGDLVAALRSRVEQLACGHPIRENYFAWQAFSRSYDHARGRALPEYLRGEHFAALRLRAGRVRTEHCGYRSYLERQEPGAYNAFVLLDAQDWMDRAELVALWTQLLRVGPAGSRVIFRTAGSASPLEAALPPEILRHVERQDEASRAAHRSDRSAIYGGFHLYVLRK